MVIFFGVMIGSLSCDRPSSSQVVEVATSKPSASKKASQDPTTVDNKLSKKSKPVVKKKKFKNLKDEVLVYDLIIGKAKKRKYLIDQDAFSFSLKNNSKKSINDIIIKVDYLDSSLNSLASETYTVINSSKHALSNEIIFPGKIYRSGFILENPPARWSKNLSVMVIYAR